MWFQILRALALHVKFSDLSSKIEGWGPRFEKSRFLFGLCRGAPPKSKTHVNQILILLHRCRPRCSGRASEHHAKNPTRTYSRDNIY